MHVRRSVRPIRHCVTTAILLATAILTLSREQPLHADEVVSAPHPIVRVAVESDTGQPLPNREVYIVRSPDNLLPAYSQDLDPIASGLTGADGSVSLTLPMERDIAAEHLGQPGTIEEAFPIDYNVVVKIDQPPTYVGPDEFRAHYLRRYYTTPDIVRARYGFTETVAILNQMLEMEGSTVMSRTLEIPTAYVHNDSARERATRIASRFSLVGVAHAQSALPCQWKTVSATPPFPVSVKLRRVHSSGDGKATSHFRIDNGASYRTGYVVGYGIEGAMTYAAVEASQGIDYRVSSQGSTSGGTSIEFAEEAFQSYTATVNQLFYTVTRQQVPWLPGPGWNCPVQQVSYTIPYPGANSIVDSFRSDVANSSMMPWADVLAGEYGRTISLQGGVVGFGVEASTGKAFENSFSITIGANSYGLDTQRTSVQYWHLDYDLQQDNAISTYLLHDKTFGQPGTDGGEWYVTYVPRSTWCCTRQYGSNWPGHQQREYLMTTSNPQVSFSASELLQLNQVDPECGGCDRVTVRKQRIEARYIPRLQSQSGNPVRQIAHPSAAVAGYLVRPNAYQIRSVHEFGYGNTVEVEDSGERFVPAGYGAPGHPNRDEWVDYDISDGSTAAGKSITMDTGVVNVDVPPELLREPYVFVRITEHRNAVVRGERVPSSRLDGHDVDFLASWTFGASQKQITATDHVDYYNDDTSSGSCEFTDS